MYKILKTKTLKQEIKDGFTLIEVMLVLAITGMILLGLLGGTFSSIAHQRYNDSLRNFAEFLSLQYSEVLSPESIGKESDDYNLGNSEEVILGKVIVFSGQDNSEVYSATLIGDIAPLVQRPTTTPSFMEDLLSSTTNAALYCGTDKSPSTVKEYIPLWESQLTQPGTEHDPYKKDRKFKGTVIIARTPNSSTINTIYSDHVYDLKEKCTPQNSKASEDLRADFALQRATGGPKIFQDGQSIGICVESDNSAVTREVKIAANGRNTSAVSTLTEEASQCH